jgi:hypothetical protein
MAYGDAEKNFSHRYPQMSADQKKVMGRLFFEAQNEAELFIDVLRTNTLAGKFKLHEFVVMPDHFHVLLTVDAIRALNGPFNSSKAGIHSGGTKSWGWRERSGRPDFPKSASWTEKVISPIRNTSMRIR